MNHPTPIVPNRPFVVMINTATVSRLASMCDRIARGLRSRGLSVQVFDTLGLTERKEFEYAYKNGQIKSQVVILQGSFYVVNGAKNRANGSLFTTKSVRPQLSFLLDYKESLHNDWKKSGDLLPDDFLALPKRAFGTDNHYQLLIKQDKDEIYACGQIVESILKNV